MYALFPQGALNSLVFGVATLQPSTGVLYWFVATQAHPVCIPCHGPDMLTSHALTEPAFHRQVVCFSSQVQNAGVVMRLQPRPGRKSR